MRDGTVRNGMRYGKKCGLYLTKGGTRRDGLVPIFALLVFLAGLMPFSAFGQIPATIDLASAEEDVTIYGATVGDQLTVGGALAVGDFNADGTDDLVLGALNADGPSDGRLTAGEAYIVYGVVPDVTPPTADTITPATTGPTNSPGVDFTVTFSEDVVNFDAAADVVVSHTVRRVRALPSPVVRRPIPFR